ncbi:hypothetical protein Mgra_00008128 [Meloidogyne graminicola]|uniref:Uncharacterized protein n=1 Tax=Meloidogyne graminicola TaxID=189291 RepID=A0A8S9ZGH8_9BILA|nr:hypothetical protein Mgra_00008128 [Meloidogyne graminicola]
MKKRTEKRINNKKNLKEKKEINEINKDFILKENLEYFIEENHLIELYKEFIKFPSIEKQKELNIAIFIYEINIRYNWLKQIENEWPKIYKLIFDLNKENKVLNKLIEKLINFKENDLKLNIIEDLNKFEIYLFKLLKELIYVIEGIWDGRQNNLNNKIKEIENIKKQLKYLLIIKALNKEEENNKWENLNKEEKNKIVWNLFNEEIITEKYKLINEIDKYLDNWKIIKTQKLIDNQIIDNFELPKYINPETFQQIYFDYKNENLTSEELEDILKKQFRDPELTENNLKIIRSSIFEWAGIINQEIKFLIGGSYMFGIDIINSDIDLIIAFKDDEINGKNKFFGTERSICEGQKEENCKDKSLYCLLCKVYKYIFI